MNAQQTNYVNVLSFVERLHRRLLDVIKDGLERAGEKDINAVQALLLYNIGDSKLTAGELRSKGCYLGSNVSYNLKKLVSGGYVNHDRNSSDKRSVNVSLTAEGERIHALVDNIYASHLNTIEAFDIDHKMIGDLKTGLGRLERFLEDQVRFKL